MNPSLPKESKSYWLETTPNGARPALTEDVTCDVVVVGGGITGLTCALSLLSEGKRVVIVEAARIASGVTGHTSAHLTAAVDARYVQLTKDFGAEGAALVARASRGAIDAIERLVFTHGIACGWKRVPGYLYSERAADLETLHAEYEAATALGLAVEMLPSAPLSFARAAVRFDDQGQFHSCQYLAALARVFEAGGGRIFENTHATDLEDGTPCILHTNSGTIRAQHVVYATHVPLTRLLLQTKTSHYQSYVLALRVDEPALPGLFWDTDDPYHYLRSAGPEGDSVLIVGGEDHKTGTERDTLPHFERLLAYAQERFKVREVVDRWSSQVVETVDGLPYIGHIPHAEHTFIATGFSGNGLTFGTAAAGIIADEILGRENAYSALFSPSRVKPIASMASFIKENAGVAAHFIGDHLKPAEAASIEDVGPGEGKIVREGMTKLAVYRDEDGRVQCHSAVCPHLGCYVQFNDAEKTWDCPCHGSRFTSDGRVFNGPAIEDLAPAKTPSSHAKANLA